MPRGKQSATLEKPASSATKRRRSNALTNERTVIPARKSRRSPYEVVQELKTRRAELAVTYEARLAKLDSRIQRLEARYEKKIKVTELLRTRTPEELARELETVKKQQAILRKALKAHQ